jgi:hypothetical protein
MVNMAAIAVIDAQEKQKKKKKWFSILFIAGALFYIYIK